MQPPGVGLAGCRHKRVPQLAGEPATETILAFRSGPRAVTDPAPMTGLCAFALAFSTLLSSQGADAHRHKAFAWFGGNPLILPASSSAVKRFYSILTASQPQVLPAYPAADRPDVRTANSGEVFLAGPGTSRLPAFGSCLGAGRTLGIQAIHVKSGERASRPCRSAACGVRR